MPRIKVENVPKVLMSVIAPDLVKNFAEAVQCPEEWVTVADSGVTVYTSGYPVVDIVWFERPKEIQDKAAEAVAKWLESAGYKRFEIYFHIQDQKRVYSVG